MKKKTLLIMLSIAVCVALIGGATMAWFTNESEATDAVFIAGTVNIKANGATILGKKNYNNITPGDCFIVEYDIENTGTTDVELRTILDLSWNNDLELDNVFIIPHPTTNWVLYQPEDETGPEHPVYVYYMGGPVSPEDIVKLRLVVYFDGEMITRELSLQ
ncbi:hypothetical protein Cst_c13260 [Thermoclostridium stercorarium subsp. stercorarium DSM 8532]|uniref:DUF4352 domain-containing protein n=1 Tax=Thermoclostridium stercorarium (strain ATCC 35414 / DSM 8532 / NCIMB 11754) TaxID=1121335 RepID=L7VNH4_THES1|nr:TasA family protein [Thermoclostridium stercorarium]AGC68317.1 hypothetical protein Cst_c13260 [Thermoclostridium stercorarium subsp. stercorarium DSM 8532]AGI39342.1 signal peptide-containing protein [Thermoclostridium stercorarium subsp. stercorarium DSM 8532]